MENMKRAEGLSYLNSIMKLVTEFMDGCDASLEIDMNWGTLRGEMMGVQCIILDIENELRTYPSYYKNYVGEVFEDD